MGIHWRKSRQERCACPASQTTTPPTRRNSVRCSVCCLCMLQWLLESPLGHLYLHHPRRSPWLDNSLRQYVWAALSNCSQHLHAASGDTSRECQQDQQEQPPRPSPQVHWVLQECILLNSRRACQVHLLLLALEPQQQAGAGRWWAARHQRWALLADRAVAGAANALAGAASAVAGPSAAATAAAGGPLTLSVPKPSQAVPCRILQGLKL
jgi:hypothetical protein